MIEVIQRPWPWYVAGPLIGLMVPLLLLIGNKTFGISSSLRHICAACVPSKIPFFSYDWKKEVWNMVLVTGILIGGIIAAYFLMNNDAVAVNQNLVAELSNYGISDFHSFVPGQLFN